MSSGRRRANEIKCECQIDENKEEGSVRLLVVNRNVFGTFSAGKIE